MPNSSKSFGEPEEHYESKVAATSAIIFAIGAMLFFVQTELFVRLFTPSRVLHEIPAAASADRYKQKSIGERYKARTGADPEHSLHFHPLFSDNHKKMLKEAADSIQNDEAFKDFRKVFKEKYGAPFEEFGAMVIPSWHTPNKLNLDQFKITEAGWQAGVNSSMSHYFVGGFTVRDRARDQWESTQNGRPRIAIDFSKFKTVETLKLALFHEILHALNMPGYKPFCLSVVPTDLAYLPEYRSFVKRLRLDKSVGGYVIGTLMMIFCVVSAAFTYKAVRLHLRSRGRTA